MTKVFVKTTILFLQCKCHSLAIRGSTGKKYDPKLQLDGKDIPFIGDCTIKFLGGPISVPQSPNGQKSRLVERLDLLLQRVDAVPVTRKLYKAGICPRLSWDLSIISLPLSGVKATLEAKATKYLKRWSGLARAADPATVVSVQDRWRPPTTTTVSALPKAEVLPG